MANTFMGKGYPVTASSAAALTAGGSETIMLLGVTIANVHATDACWVTADVIRSGSNDSELAHQVSIPVNDSLDLLQGKVVLNSGEVLKLQAEAGLKLEASLSYLVQT